MKICSVEDCTGKVHAKNMCRSHNYRARNHGTPTGGHSYQSAAEKACGVPRVCTVEGCADKYLAKGLCSLHYSRFLKHGTVDATVAPRKRQATLTAGLLARIPKGLDPTDCWEWEGTRTVKGYGIVSYQRKQYRAHRVAYEYWVGPIPDGQVVRHRCDNPPCTNPHHLEVGTHKDNTQDAVARGRLAREKSNTSLTQATADDLRRDYADGVDKPTLSVRYGVSRRTVRDVLNGRTWNPYAK